MNRSKHSRAALAGWLVVVGLLGIIVGGGFQDGKEKYGVVDPRKVVFDSKLFQEMSDRVETERLARLTILQFMDTHRVLTEDQATRIRDLEFKEDKTDDDETELEAIQQAVIAAAKDFDRLSTIPNMTDDERLLYQDYTQRRNTTTGLGQQWGQEFERSFATIVDQADREANDRAQAAVAAVAKREGYTIVFSSSAVTYAANDITEAATAEANK